VLSDFAKGADILVHKVIDLTGVEQRLKASTPPDRLARLVNHMRTEHTTPEQVGRVANEAGVKLVVLSHLVLGSNDPSGAVLVDRVKELFNGPVVVGKDLMEF